MATVARFDLPANRDEVGHTSAMNTPEIRPPAGMALRAQGITF
jgi:hypothetical protein